MEEKERRKGKFNIVDIIVILILILGVALVGTKLLGGDDGAGITSTTRIEYTVLVRQVDARVCENVMAYKDANVQLMANGALVDGYVTDITYENNVVYLGDDQGEMHAYVEQGEHARKSMIFTIQATVDSPVTNKVGTQEVRIGKGHIVKTTEFEMEGYSATILSKQVIQ